MFHRMPLLLVPMLLIASAWAAPVSSPEVGAEVTVTTETNPGTGLTVYRFMLHDEMIDGSTEFYLTRAFARAEASGADVIIIDMDTPGGELGATMNIRNRILESDIPIYTYIRHWAISAGALIALSTDGVFMGPSSSIGGAQPITSTGEGMNETVDEKITSIMRSEIRSTLREQARQNPERWTEEELAHLILIAEAFITPPDEDIMSANVSGEIVCSAGELLTMDFTEALREGLAQARAEDLDDCLEQLGYGGATIREVNLTWSENLARFLSRRVVTSFLILAILGGLYLEFKAPGIGLPLAVAVIAAALFFFGTSVADLSSHFEIALVVIGILLLAVEVLLIPGFGLPGIMGFVCIVSGLVMALVKLPPPDTNLEFRMIYIQGALSAVAWGMVLSVVAAAIGLKYIPRTKVWRFLDLEPATINGVEAAIPMGSTIESASELVGKRGVAQTDLRPAGTVEIDGDPYDVVTRGEFIEQGTDVRVLETHGIQIIVAAYQAD